jgi:Cell division protein FtsI/penicillin-binding protein 2
MFGRDEKPSHIRLTAVQYVVLGIFLFLAYGLWRLQVSQSEYYSAAAERNRVREVPILAPRGKILDRYGRTIVDNYTSFTALLMRDSSRNLEADAPLIAQGLHLDPKEVREKIHHFASLPQYQPIYLKEDITMDEEAFIEAHKSELPELDSIMAYRRLYPRKGFLAHLVGYVGEVSEDMLNQPQFELYNPRRCGRKIRGRTGIQPAFDGHQRIAPGGGEQPRQGSWRGFRGKASRPGQTA